MFSCWLYPISFDDYLIELIFASTCFTSVNVIILNCQMLAKCSVLGSLIQGITYLSCIDLVIFCFCFCFWEWLLKALWGSSNGFETLELHNKCPLVEPWGGDAPYLICFSCLTNLAQLHRVSSLLRLRETSTCRVWMHWGFFHGKCIRRKVNKILTMRMKANATPRNSHHYL